MHKVRQSLFGSRKKKVVSAIITGIIMVAAASSAAWLVTTSTGSGSGKAGTLSAPTITNATAAVGDLYPSAGLLTGALQFVVNNPNSGALVLTGIGPITKTAIVGGTAQCDFSTAPIRAHVNVKVTATTGLSIPIPVGVSNVSIPNMLGLAADTITQCQGQQFDGLGLTNAVFSTP